MKHIFFCAGILFLVSASVQAQTKSKKTNKKQTVHSRTASQIKQRLIRPLMLPTP